MSIYSYSLHTKEFFHPSLFHLSSFWLEKCVIEFLLITRDLGWYTHLNMYAETSFSSFSIEPFHTFITKHDNESMLSSCLDINRAFSKDRKFDDSLSTEYCFSRRYMDTIVEICSFSCESSFIFWNCECDIEISASIISLVSFSTEFYGHTIFDSFWYIYSFFYFFSDFSSCMTITTFFCNFFSFSMTRSTCSSLFHNTKNCLNSFTNLSLSITGMTLIGFSSFSTTVMAGSIFIKFYLATYSEDSILEWYLESHLDILTYISSCSGSPTSSTHSTTKEWRENITKISRIKSSLESSSKSTKSSLSMIIHSSMTIIMSFFLLIWENLISFVELFEFSFFLFVTTMTIWMDFHSFFSIGFFYLIRCGGLYHSEDNIVFFGHRKIWKLYENKREDTSETISKNIETNVSKRY